MKSFWLIGALVIGLGVSMVGYQGGELTYGEDHYAKEFQRLFNTEEEVEAPADEAEPTSSEEESASKDSE